MSRRKVRGLTKTGRQVSEDPDLDNLLSNLSPEEMEELQKEVSVVPDPDPSEIIIVDQTDLKAVPPAKKDSQPGSQEKSGFQRNLSTEGEPKKESRKQEYLRKMGLSQEKNISRSDSIEGGLQRQTSITSPSSFPKHDGKTEDRSSRVTEGNKDDKAGPSFFSKKEEESEKKGEVKEKEQNDGNKLRDRRETRESSSSKTKELISKLQEKKEDAKEKSRKEDSRKRESGESRAKEMISRIKEKEEKEKEKKDEIRKREENKIKSNTSRLEEKQNEVLENKAEDKRKEEKKNKDDKQVVKDDKQVVKDDKQVVKDDKQVVKDNKQVVKSNESGKEGPTKDEKKHAEHKDKEQVEKGKEKIKIPDTRNADSCEKGKREIQEHNEITNEVHESIKEDKIGNCVSDTISKSKTKEEEEEDESASMFDEDLERVRRNDPGMTEVNVNNSEVIKTKTLIQFAEALKNNTHIKSFSLANCRADDHVAYAIAETLRSNKSITSVNMDSNLLTSKGIMALIYSLQHNSTLTELRFHNQRHICGGKSEMEMTKILKENTTLLKLGYHFELAGPRMTMTNILSRNMDRQRQKRLQEQKQAQAQGTGDKKDSLEVPKTSFGKGSPKASPKASPKPSPLPSPIPSPAPSPKLTHKKGGRGPGGGPPPPPPPGGPPPPPPPMLDGDFLKNSLTPVSQRKLEDRTGGRGASQNSRDQLLASIRGSNIKQLKKVSVPKLLQ